ncbi:basic proline-rich protein-like [Peromyscus californicus insignis]|uniref:basic proline-rich protein-like n=1 Tax=Peromyscus californicus insignis TaxID=564181 RepID=UPI0022A79409|nr:basic proline-rich protein-like [Peromyscus californicus insignis]
MRKPGTRRGGRVPWLPGVKQEGREPKQDEGGCGGEGQPCRRGRAGTLILTRDPPPPQPPPPPPPPDSTPPRGRDPRPSRGPSPHATGPRAALPPLPPPPPVRPPSPKSSRGNEIAWPLPGTPAPRPTCAGGGELSRGASEANRSAARRMRPSSHFPAPPPRLAKFAGNLPGRAPTGPGGSARVHGAGGGGRRPRVLAAPEGPPGPAALAPPLRPPAPPAR